MARHSDLSGRKFNRLTVSEYFSGSRKSRGKWKCLCDCGNTVFVETSQLLNQDTQSCGCLKRQRASETHATHKMSFSLTYSSWHNMKTRCDNPNATNFSEYGGRGIVYDPRWELFENFLEDMGECPAGLSLDRRDPHENYYKENCHWATDSHQSFNKRLKGDLHTGISKTPNGKWRAMIHKDKIKYHLGCFENYEDALKIRKEFEIKLYEKELS